MASPIATDPFDRLRPHLVKHADLEQLAPYLRGQSLLTDEEYRQVGGWSRVLSKYQAVEKLVEILKEKGPKAFTLFEEAVRLSAEGGVGSSGELLKVLQQGLDKLDLLDPFVSLEWRRSMDWEHDLGRCQFVVLEGKVYVTNDKTLYLLKSDNRSYDKVASLQYERPAFTTYKGQLITAGGRDSSEQPTNQLAVWDAEETEWTHPLPPMPTARDGATAIGYGKYLIVAGGWNLEGKCDVVEIYDGERWITAQSLPKKCTHMRSTFDGTYWYLMGGNGQEYSVYYTPLHSFIQHSIEQSQQEVSTHSPLWSTLPELPFTEAIPAIFCDRLIVIGDHDHPKLLAYSSYSQTWEYVGDVPVSASEYANLAVLPSQELLLAHSDGYMDVSMYMATLKRFPDSRITMKALQHLEKLGGIHVVNDVAPIWLKMAFSLSMYITDINEIYYKEDPNACCKAMFEKLTAGHKIVKQLTTWRILLRSLRENDREELAKRIEKFSSLKLTEETKEDTKEEGDKADMTTQKLEAQKRMYEDVLAEKDKEIAEYEQSQRTIKAYTDTMALRSHEHVKAIQNKNREISSLQARVQELEEGSQRTQEPRPVQTHGEATQDQKTAGYLRGAEVIGETSFLVSGDKPQTYEWKGYGLKLSIPEGALPPESPPTPLNIKATLSGQFEFPDDTELASGIFWIHFPEKFLKPVTVEIQHCAVTEYPSQCSSLSFVRAKCTQENLPYTFKHLQRGVFSPHSSYGSISVTHFSGHGIVMKRPQRKHRSTQSDSVTSKASKTSSGDARTLATDVAEEKRYSAQLYYIPKGINKWMLHFVIFWDLEIYNTAVNQKYAEMKAEAGPYQRVFFEEEEICLDISEEGVVVKKGWSVVPLMHPGIIREYVDSYVPGQQIPCCQLRLKWTLRDKEPEELFYRVEMLGAKKPFNFFSIMRDPLQEGSYSGSEPPSPASSSALTSPLKKGPECYAPELSDLMNEVAVKVPNKWRDIGIGLGLTPNDLDCFSLATFGNCNQCFVAVFTAWKNRMVKEYTWDTIIQILKTPLVGESRLARELNAKVTATI